ncbi:hopanoid biosynthesis-associated protein HpnK [Sphingomonas abietis]|uniref:Hopanoid biosynthesis-associated protein HpnK n=1 Tax=Sphingomonas abietis TaxID=3012344 RepID=A0ABY7NN88_9SPHN|nr:hopanoid biosynthesis-associated protein HpnK [Sphingomonas abietis]WBO22992.1 hopanoid biosynthesis-associated protein HpnK [Sphingomonas abietis]
MTNLIITADDFGASIAVNEGIEAAHRTGILTAASLMVAGEAAEDALIRARHMPTLGVGLHLVLVEGRPALPASQVPDLVDASGHFRTNMALAGAAMFFRPAVRRQLAAEIEAQFAAFHATGLRLDHVNAHKHFHLHPTIAGLILKIGARYGLTAARAPVEPVALLAAIEPVPQTIAGRIAAPYARGVARRFRAAGLLVPDRVLGLAWSGHMTPQRVRGLIERLPPGLTELYLHPATDDHYPGSAPGYQYRAELAALVDPTVRDAIVQRNVTLGSFQAFGRKGAIAA